MKLKNSFLIILFSLGFMAMANDGSGIKQVIPPRYLEDPKGDMTPEDVIGNRGFVTNSKDADLNLGVSESAFWLDFSIEDDLEEDAQLIIAQPSLELVELYSVFEGRLLLIDKQGVFEAFNNRGHKSQNFIFNLNKSPDPAGRYLLKVKGSKQLIIPISYGGIEEVWHYNLNNDIFFSVYFGVIFIMLLYNLFIYFSVKDKNYIYYVVYLGLALMAQISIKGYGFKYIWKNWLWFEDVSTVVFPSIAGMMAIVFAQQFLVSHVRLPKLNNVLHVFSGLFILASLAAMIGFVHAGFQMMQTITMFASLFVFYISVVTLYRYKDSAASYFLVAWSILLLGAIVYVLRDFGVLPQNVLTNNALITGQALEMSLLSFALADKINTYRQEKLLAVQEKENLLKEQNITLERQVAERTNELDVKNSALNEALKELKDTQAQLVQSEKMSSLGQLTAGIAHEINNPMNYAKQSVVTIKKDMEDLRELLERYDEIDIGKTDSLDRQWKEIQMLKEDIELDYLHTEIDDAIEDVEDGIKRAVEIASELKTFSRVDEAVVKYSDLHEGINSTLELMKSEMGNSKIRIDKNFDDIPEIECRASKLNQVFLNILNNSVYAIRESVNEKNGIIGIQTINHENGIDIIFTDNGKGMDEETRSKIFDPFYTTKEVGKGSGLGMSISYGIINEHGGKLKVQSEVGKGTTIEIFLPKKIKTKEQDEGQD